MNGFSPALSRLITRVTDAALGPHQTAVIRIGFSLTWLLFLLREFPHRHELYGPDGPWSWDLAEQLIATNDAFTVLLWSDSRGWFEAVYALAVLWSLLLLLGWRTRTMSVLFMVGVLALQNRSVFMGDGGDNVLHLMSVYLVFTRCGQVWSLDARRARRAAAARARGERPRDRVGPALWGVLGLSLLLATLAGRMDGDWFIPALLWTVWAAQALWWLAGRRAGTGQARILLDVVANIVHNGALFVIMAEACLILRHGRLVQDPGVALAGRHRRLLPVAPGVLLALAGPRGPAVGQRHHGDAGDLRDGGRAGRLPVHAVQPAGQEPAAGVHDHGARGDRRGARAALLLPGDDRGRRGLPADVLPAPAGRSGGPRGGTAAPARRRLNPGAAASARPSRRRGAGGGGPGTRRSAESAHVGCTP